MTFSLVSRKELKDSSLSVAGWRLRRRTHAVDVVKFAHSSTQLPWQLLQNVPQHVAGTAQVFQRQATSAVIERPLFFFGLCAMTFHCRNWSLSAVAYAVAHCLVHEYTLDCAELGVMPKAEHIDVASVARLLHSLFICGGAGNTLAAVCHESYVNSVDGDGLMYIGDRNGHQRKHVNYNPIAYFLWFVNQHIERLRQGRTDSRQHVQEKIDVLKRELVGENAKFAWITSKLNRLNPPTAPDNDESSNNQQQQQQQQQSEPAAINDNAINNTDCGNTSADAGDSNVNTNVEDNADDDDNDEQEANADDMKAAMEETQETSTDFDIWRFATIRNMWTVMKVLLATPSLAIETLHWDMNTLFHQRTMLMSAWVILKRWYECKMPASEKFQLLIDELNAVAPAAARCSPETLSLGVSGRTMFTLQELKQLIGGKGLVPFFTDAGVRAAIKTTLRSGGNAKFSKRAAHLKGQRYDVVKMPRERLAKLRQLRNHEVQERAANQHVQMRDQRIANTLTLIKRLASEQHYSSWAQLRARADDEARRVFNEGGGLWTYIGTTALLNEFGGSDLELLLAAGIEPALLDAWGITQRHHDFETRQTVFHWAQARALKALENVSPENNTYYDVIDELMSDVFGADQSTTNNWSRKRVESYLRHIEQMDVRAQKWWRSLPKTRIAEAQEFARQLVDARERQQIVDQQNTARDERKRERDECNSRYELGARRLLAHMQQNEEDQDAEQTAPSEQQQEQPLWTEAVWTGADVSYLQTAVDGHDTFANVAAALKRTEAACKKKALEMRKQKKRRVSKKPKRATRRGWSDAENDKLRQLYEQHTVVNEASGRRTTDYKSIALVFVEHGRTESSLRRQASVLNLSSVKWLDEEVAVLYGLQEGKAMSEIVAALNNLPCNKQRKMKRKEDACLAKARLIGLT